MFQVSVLSHVYTHHLRFPPYNVIVTVVATAAQPHQSVYHNQLNSGQAKQLSSIVLCGHRLYVVRTQ